MKNTFQKIPLENSMLINLGIKQSKQEIQRLLIQKLQMKQWENILENYLNRANWTQQKSYKIFYPKILYILSSMNIRKYIVQQQAITGIQKSFQGKILDQQVFNFYKNFNSTKNNEFRIQKHQHNNTKSKLKLEKDFNSHANNITDKFSHESEKWKKTAEQKITKEANELRQLIQKQNKKWRNLFFCGCLIIISTILLINQFYFIFVLCSTIIFTVYHNFEKKVKQQLETKKQINKCIEQGKKMKEVEWQLCKKCYQSRINYGQIRKSDTYKSRCGDHYCYMGFKQTTQYPFQERACPHCYSLVYENKFRERCQQCQDLGTYFAGMYGQKYQNRNYGKLL